MEDSDAAGTSDIWFETATVVTTFLLVGRWLEARATDRTRDALRGLLTLGAKDVAVERVDPEEPRHDRGPHPGRRARRR